MTSPRAIVPVFVAAALALAACSGGDDAAPATTDAPTTTVARPTTTRPAASSTSTSTTSSTVTPTTEPAEPEVLRMPLTGEPIADESEIPNRPALAVKIPTYPARALPQAGLNDADIVFETIINSGATRLIAVFHTGDSDPVGPIRSGRAQDVNLLGMFNEPLMAWSGGNPSVTQEFRRADEELDLLVDLNAVREHSGLYYRRSGRGGSPHNLFSSTEALWSATPEQFTLPKVVFPYLGVDEEPEGEPSTELSIQLDTIESSWVYDEATQRYLRSQNGRESMTEDDGQVWADNVVVMLADYGVNPNDGNPDLQSRGSNPVLIFSHGTVRQGMWVRFEPTDGFLFVDNLDDLNPLGLVPGRTWVEVPRNQCDSVEFEGGSQCPATTATTEG